MKPYIMTQYGVSRIRLDYCISKIELLELLNDPGIPDNASLEYEMGYYDEISIVLSWYAGVSGNNS